MTTRPAVRRWPLFLIAAPAAVAVWSGWVGLGTLCGFGIVHPLPGIADGFRLNTAITLPVGVEAYGAYALGAWLTPGTSDAARKFARRSALGSLLLGMAGQVIYHLLAAAHAQRAPWPVVVLVSCLPVITLGFGAGLTHLLRAGNAPTGDTPADTSAAAPADSHPDNAADTARPPARTPRRTPARTGTAAAVARLRARHPDMPAADIARRLGVSDRTVRRHIASQPAPAEASPAAA
jgi:DNA-binding CsgD family transcriptional regulator